MNIELHQDAILVKEIVKKEEVTQSGILIVSDTSKEKLFEVIEVGTKVITLSKGDIIRVKEVFGEALTIEHKSYLYFPHGDSSYYYKLI